MSHLERGVVDQNIDTTELGHGLVDDVVAVLFLRKVAWQQQALAASGFDPARRLLRIFVLIQIAYGNVSLRERRQSLLHARCRCRHR